MVEAAVFYEDQAIHLGEHFLAIVAAAVFEIAEAPELWPERDNGMRRRPLRRFPYSILYRIDNDEIIIVAVMHQKRRPNYWVRRV